MLEDQIRNILKQYLLIEYVMSKDYESSRMWRDANCRKFSMYIPDRVVKLSDGQILEYPNVLLINGDSIYCINDPTIGEPYLKEIDKKNKEKILANSFKALHRNNVIDLYRGYHVEGEVFKCYESCTKEEALGIAKERIEYILESIKDENIKDSCQKMVTELRKDFNSNGIIGELRKSTKDAKTVTNEKLFSWDEENNYLYNRTKFDDYNASYNKNQSNIIDEIKERPIKEIGKEQIKKLHDDGKEVKLKSLLMAECALGQVEMWRSIKGIESNPEIKILIPNREFELDKGEFVKFPNVILEVEGNIYKIIDPLGGYPNLCRITSKKTINQIKSITDNDKSLYFEAFTGRRWEVKEQVRNLIDYISDENEDSIKLIDKIRKSFRSNSIISTLNETFKSNYYGEEEIKDVQKSHGYQFIEKMRKAKNRFLETEFDDFKKQLEKFEYRYKGQEQYKKDYQKLFKNLSGESKVFLYNYMLYGNRVSKYQEIAKKDIDKYLDNYYENNWYTFGFVKSRIDALIWEEESILDKKIQDMADMGIIKIRNDDKEWLTYDEKKHLVEQENKYGVFSDITKSTQIPTTIRTCKEIKGLEYLGFTDYKLAAKTSSITLATKRKISHQNKFFKPESTFKHELEHLKGAALSTNMVTYLRKNKSKFGKIKVDEIDFYKWFNLKLSQYVKESIKKDMEYIYKWYGEDKYNTNNTKPRLYEKLDGMRYQEVLGYRAYGKEYPYEFTAVAAEIDGLYRKALNSFYDDVVGKSFDKLEDKDIERILNAFGLKNEDDIKAEIEKMNKRQEIKKIFNVKKDSIEEKLFQHVTFSRKNIKDEVSRFYAEKIIYSVLNDKIKEIGKELFSKYSTEEDAKKHLDEIDIEKNINMLVINDYMSDKEFPKIDQIVEELSKDEKNKLSETEKSDLKEEITKKAKSKVEKYFNECLKAAHNTKLKENIFYYYDKYLKKGKDLPIKSDVYYSFRDGRGIEDSFKDPSEDEVKIYTEMKKLANKREGYFDELVSGLRECRKENNNEKIREVLKENVKNIWEFRMVLLSADIDLGKQYFYNYRDREDELMNKVINLIDWTRKVNVDNKNQSRVDLIVSRLENRTYDEVLKSGVKSITDNESFKIYKGFDYDLEYENDYNVKYKINFDEGKGKIIECSYKVDEAIDTEVGEPFSTSYMHLSATDDLLVRVKRVRARKKNNEINEILANECEEHAKILKEYSEYYKKHSEFKGFYELYNTLYNGFMKETLNSISVDDFNKLKEEEKSNVIKMSQNKNAKEQDNINIINTNEDVKEQNNIISTSLKEIKNQKNITSKHESENGDDSSSLQSKQGGNNARRKRNHF